MREKLIPMSLIVDKGSKDIDSIARRRKGGEGTALQVLMEANQAWDGMLYFRQERERNKRYSYGDQWGDYISVDGKRMTEEQYIKSQGNVALKNNIMRRLERAVIGVARSQSKEPICTARDRNEQQYGEIMSTVLQYNMQLNKMKSIHARTLEEFLISGFAVHRKWHGWRNDKLDCWTDMVQPNNFFIDGNMRDIRGWDVSLLGEIHDISFKTLIQRFASSPSDYNKLKKIYSQAHDADMIQTVYSQFGSNDNQNNTFLLATDPTRCRVFEVWRKEAKPRYRCRDYNNGDIYKVDIEDYKELVLAENERRTKQGLEAGMSVEEIPLIKAEWFVDDYWYYYFLSPFGDILEEGETPYQHHSHPYVFVAYPFIDGEIHSFASDFLDQQRYINRLITMHDWIMRASAKGLLLFPEDCIPDGMSMDDIADEWARFNGVMVVKKGAQNLPQQISNNATNIGITDLLNLQLKLIEDISGVSGSLQGKPGYSGMSASLYAQQSQNSTTGLLDILETYSDFVRDGATKDVKNIQQFYDEKKTYNISGKSSKEVVYDPEKINDIEFDLNIAESVDTPVYRQQANETLLELWKAQAISAQQLLEVGNFPFADELLQLLKSQEEQLGRGDIPDASISPELMQRVQQGSNQANVDKAYNTLRGNAA